ncbi:hypothetical protein [Bacillus sp. B-jedd]|uniref:hypothetical protein n=1 Tax=Bacillus sp. B-jedd TaxID=1476857 RepID=UPI0005155662|nr:hypothetical protein [Bacillus sp. B-jedd]CEG26230.1 hypothetical protein BN1002_01072 [Bacillus sp. B-jedd]
MQKKVKTTFIILSVLIIYFVFLREKFPIVDELPEEIRKEFDVVLDEKRDRVSLEKDGKYESIAIFIDQDRALYIANSVGHNITKFTIDQDKKEIYIRKNNFDYKNGRNDKFQLIKLPFSKYKDIAMDKKLTVYLDYGKGHELREYYFPGSEYIVLEHTDTTK